MSHKKGIHHSEYSASSSGGVDAAEVPCTRGLDRSLNIITTRTNNNNNQGNKAESIETLQDGDNNGGESPRLSIIVASQLPSPSGGSPLFSPSAYASISPLPSPMTSLSSSSFRNDISSHQHSPSPRHPPHISRPRDRPNDLVIPKTRARNTDLASRQRAASEFAPTSSNCSQLIDDGTNIVSNILPGISVNPASKFHDASLEEDISSFSALPKPNKNVNVLVPRSFSAGQKYNQYILQDNGPIKREAHIISEPGEVAQRPSADKEEPQYESIYTAFPLGSVIPTYYKFVQTLGQGAFSKVVMAERLNVVPSSPPENNTSPNNCLVAIKIVNLSCPSDTTRSRIIAGLQREIDILSLVRHPSLIRLLAYSCVSNGPNASDATEQSALLVMPCAKGGDLFDFSKNWRSQLSVNLVRRIFAELCGAVAYLHDHFIVHRDIKLENVLINRDVQEIIRIQSPCAVPYAVISLTDFGLARRIDPDSPLLTTRCGSEDYAPPELLMGQPYDGRETDVWALGVLLYGIMEGRLPFDVIPRQFMTGGVSPTIARRGRTAHRVARLEWQWLRFSHIAEIRHAAGMNDSMELKDIEAWQGAKHIVESCLCRRDKRISLADILNDEWVKGGIDDSLRGGKDNEPLYSGLPFSD